ncbi:aspartyl-phosphate phosphatase Spo0E family protein [Bacillus sp. IITD106]|nr:aspartyl-phosphate phosphatase Spo0E family protein [Bacillus sp. IITD106]
MSNKQLLAKIENKRQQLLSVAAQTGLTSALSLQYSMELDTLINQYYHLLLKKAT